jgi:hypothetical protein
MDYERSNDIEQQEILTKLDEQVRELSIGQANISQHRDQREQIIHSQIHKVLVSNNDLVASVNDLNESIKKSDAARRQTSEKLIRETIWLPDPNYEETDFSLPGVRPHEYGSLRQSLQTADSHTYRQIVSPKPLIATQSQKLEVVSASSILSAETADILGRLIRTELRNQLEPMAHHLDRLDDTINRIASEISGKAAKEGIFSMKLDKRDTVQDFVVPNRSTAAIHSGADSWLAYPKGGQDTLPRVFKPVILFKFHREWETRLGHFRLRVNTCRTRDINNRSEKFFEIRLDFFPRPWLYTRGIEVRYSTRANASGFYDICPSIYPFFVSSRQQNDDDIWQDIYIDDVDNVRKMIAGGHVRFRDVLPDGVNFLSVRLVRTVITDLHIPLTVYQHAMKFNSQGVILYLLQEFGANSEMLLEDSGMSLYDAWEHLTGYTVACAGYNELSIYTTQKILSILADMLGGQGEEMDSELQLGLCLPAKIPFEKAISVVRIYLEAGVPLDPLYMYEYYEDNRCADSLDLFLSAGGNPNHTSYFGTNLLVHILLWSYPDKKRMFRLLIQAGVDLYYIIDNGENETEMPTTYTELAGLLNLKNSWREALEECGYDVDEVYAESHRRLEEYRKLHRARATAVDTEAIVSVYPVSGLRYRNGRGKDDGDRGC